MTDQDEIRSSASDFDTSHRKEITCPYCGYVFEDSWEFGDTDGGETDCYECEKSFEFYCNVSITYSSYKKES